MAIIEERNVDVSSQSYQEATLEGNRPIEVFNAFINHKEIWKECNRNLYYKPPSFRKMLMHEIKQYARYHMGRLPSRTDLVSLKGAEKGPCIVIGSGPSLNKDIDKLQDWKGGIICSQSHAATLRYYRADPTHIVVFDGKAHWDHMAKTDGFDYEKTNLVMCPTGSPSFMQNWKGRMIFYRVWDPYIEWYDKILKIAYGGIRGHNLPFACSMAAQIGIAHFLGYSPIYLFGCDLGWREGGGKARFDTMEYRNGNWYKSEFTEPNIGAYVRVGPYVTDSLTLFYKITVASLIWLDNPQVVSCSDGLLNDLLPVDDGHGVISRQGVPNPDTTYKSTQLQRDDISAYLAANQRFWIHSGVNAKGDEQYKLISCLDWKTQLPLILQRMVDVGEDIDVAKEMENAKRHFAEAVRRGYETVHRLDGKLAASVNSGTADNATQPEVVG